MRAQLLHLIDMCDHPNVTLQILPFSAGAHRAMGGPFTILRYTEPDLRDVVFIEQLTSALYLDKQTEVDSLPRGDRGGLPAGRAVGQDAGHPQVRPRQSVGPSRVPREPQRVGDG
jgi:hypothetical protein